MTALPGARGNTLEPMQSGPLSTTPRVDEQPNDELVELTEEHLHQYNLLEPEPDTVYAEDCIQEERTMDLNRELFYYMHPQRHAADPLSSMTHAYIQSEQFSEAVGTETKLHHPPRPSMQTPMDRFQTMSDRNDPNAHLARIEMNRNNIKYGDLESVHLRLPERSQENFEYGRLVYRRANNRPFQHPSSVTVYRKLQRKYRRDGSPKGLNEAAEEHQTGS